SARWMEVRAYPSTAGLAVYLRDLTAQKRLESFKIEQAALVERIAAGAPLAEILNSAVRLIEEQYPFALCSILLLDPSGERLCHGAAPNLPPAFVQAIEGAKIGPAVGTCGTAAFLKKDVVTEDILKDPAWGPFREAARAHGLRACWSIPIFSSDRQVLGTFAVYARTPRKPEPGERELVESGAHIVRIAIERRRSEDRVRESQRVLATLLSNLPGMAYRSHRDPPWTIEFVSKGCRELTGYLPEDLVGNRRASFESLTHPEDRERVHEEIEAALALGHSYDLTYRIITAQQQIKWVWERGTEVESEAGKPRLCEGFVTDITEKKNLEQQFFRAQRMESIGTLAGGIAHDLNNVLAPILMSVDLLKLSPHSEDEERILATIEASTKRGADMVRQVLAFARGVEGHHVPTPPRHVIGEVVNVIAETFPKSITYEVSVARDVWMIRGDPTQINQVLLNLCVNARDAMEPAGGRLLITAENVYIDEATMRLNGEGRMGPHVLIQVSDSGSGIPPEIRERIFEPFFTTKGIGRGTGLGLATVASIVRSHGGFIRLESEVGKGTSFKVYFPAQPKSELASPVAPAAPPPRGRGETILVVDDEMSVRLITRRSLESFGYRVLLAENGAVALDLYRRFRPEIAAIVTDMMMPVLDGAALIAELAQMDAGVRILAVSGITPAVGSPNVPRLDRLQFLAKPYSVEALLISLHRVLTL
ncbi:MAG: PAS domain-containing protein, partial [Opitutaceae bacterium]|nr:PAS domain-containing protein [Opitutaceae bacterium]